MEELLESDSDDNEDLHVSQVLSVRGNSWTISWFSNGWLFEVIMGDWEYLKVKVKADVMNLEVVGLDDPEVMNPTAWTHY